MGEYEIKKFIQETKELRDIRDEYQKTQQLLEEKRWDELQNHITYVMVKHPIDAVLHNLVNSCMPNTIEQNAINCMSFLENLFKEKLGINITDVVKYLAK